MQDEIKQIIQEEFNQRKSPALGKQLSDQVTRIYKRRLHDPAFWEEFGRKMETIQGNNNTQAEIDKFYSDVEDLYLGILKNPDKGSTAVQAGSTNTAVMEKIRADEIQHYASHYSSTISQYTRQLCLAGLAICWFFMRTKYNQVPAREGEDTYVYHIAWLVPIGAFLLVVLLDYIHNNVAYNRFYNLQRVLWQGRREEVTDRLLDIQSVANIRRLYRSKWIALLVAYILLFLSIGAKIFMWGWLLRLDL